MTLRTRLAAISAIAFGLLLTALALGSYRVLSRRLDADASDRLAELTEGLHGYLHFDDGSAVVTFDETDDDQAAFVHEATRYYQVYDATTGLMLAESDSFRHLGWALTPTEVQAYAARPGPVDLQTDYGRLRIANSVKSTADRRRYLLQVGTPLKTLDDILTNYRELLWGIVPISIGAVGLLSWWLSAVALRPLSRMAAAVGPIDVQTLERRLPVRGVGDELDRVAGAFNETLGRLEHSVIEMRQFSAALAHELRTPLTVLRAEIELALRHPGTSDAQQRSFESQIEEVDRLTRLIDQILTLARAESGQIRLGSAPVDLDGLARSIVEQLEPVAESRMITLRCEATDAVVVEGDAGWLERLILNLLGNALKFTKPGGRIVVHVYREEDDARIDVQDTGVGLSPDDAQQVFERFFRADRARTTEGSGLGLSLVQWIVARHHGTVTVESRLGAGSTFTVRLPLHHPERSGHAGIG